MNLIVSADRNWGIGYQGELLFRVKEDMAYFRRMTLGKTVVMGRKTLESLPGGKPLPDRDSLILTRDPGYRCQGARVFHSLEALLAGLEGRKHEDVFVIGGSEVYRQLMPYCRKAYITRWEAQAQADAFLPDFDASPAWRLAEQSPPQTQGELTFRFCTYEQQNPTVIRSEETK